MYCKKIDSECIHEIVPDEKYVFVAMPFKDSKSVYDSICQAVRGQGLNCDRADQEYTEFSIWCDRVCASIQKARYLIVDVTGGNPNVFFEHGIAFTLPTVRTIIITSDDKGLPFNLGDLSYIHYDIYDLPALRDKLSTAISVLENKMRNLDKIYQNQLAKAAVEPDYKQLFSVGQALLEKYQHELHQSNERELALKSNLKQIESSLSQLAGEADELKKKYLNLMAENNRLRAILEESDGSKDDSKSNKEAILWAEEGFEQFAAGNFPEAIIYLSKSLELNSERAEVYNKRGLACYYLNKYTQAIQDYDRAISIDPNLSVAYNNRGAAYLKLGSRERALKDFDKAIKLDKTRVSAYNNRGKAYYALGQYKRALVDFNKVISLDKNCATAYYNRSLVYFMLQDYKYAWADIIFAHQLAPNDPYYSETRDQMAILLRNMGFDWEERIR